MHRRMDEDLPANCTCLNLRKAARAVTQAYDHALKPSGLRATQFSLLGAVANKGPIGMTALAEVLVTDRTTLTRNLKPLIALGLLRVLDGEDRRERPVAVTAKGRQRLAKAMPMWRKAQAHMTRGLGHDRWAGLLSDLGKSVRLAHGR